MSNLQIGRFIKAFIYVLTVDAKIGMSMFVAVVIGGLSLIGVLSVLVWASSQLLGLFI